MFRAQRHRGLDGAVLGPEAFVLRFFGENGDDRLLLVNFGLDLHLDPAPEPLLAPPEAMSWEIIWSSENPSTGAPEPLPRKLLITGKYQVTLLWSLDRGKLEKCNHDGFGTQNSLA